jgi:Polyketide cyclase / dehydrase and lipid transport
VNYLVTRSKVVAAPAAAIFDVIATPSRHQEIDGSGSVKGPQADAPPRLSKDAKFGMSMKIGVPYKMENTVVEFEENRTIAWKHFGGHLWRYDLEPIGDGSTTKVTESFDWSTSRSKFLLRLIAAPARNAKSIEKTLDRMAALFASN